ncbi:MAG: DUF3352 domain-containing protein [Flavobacteriales bacterium]|nr:DUF3352 domain-containing protein [Flavobacteriales bacterium]
MKKLLIALAVLAILLAGGGIYWKSLQQPEVDSDPVDAIPTSASLIMAYPNLTATWSAFQERDYSRVLHEIDELTVFLARNARLDSLLTKDAELKEALKGAMVWRSYHATEADSLQVFQVIKVRSGFGARALEAWKKSFGSDAGAITEEKNGETSIFKVVTSHPYSISFFTLKNGLLLSSSSASLLKQSLSQLAGGQNLSNDANFRSALETAGKNVDANLYVNYGNLPKYLAGALKPGLQSLNRTMVEFADWSEFDVNMKSEGFTLNGFTYVNDSLPQFLSLFLDQKPQSMQFAEFIPSNTASFVFYGIEDVIAFSSGYRELLSKQGDLSKMEAELDSANQLLGVDLEQNLLAWMGNSFGMCITRPTSPSFADNGYLVFETRSEELAEKLLSDLADELDAKHEKELESEEVNGTQIRHLRLDGILGVLFGETLKEYDNPFYAIYKGCVVFGTSSESVADYIEHLQADRTLGKDLSFSRFVENLGSAFNMFSYNHIPSSEKIFESYLNHDAVSMLESNREHINKFEAIGTQFSSTGQSFYSNTFIKYNPSSKAQKESHWLAQMDAAPIIPPVFVTNHISGEPEILVQDETNNVYLFNQLGQELFKAEIKEPILSRPVQVDAFKNGKLQYLFNTKNFIYLIDREGNLVDGYPIELNSPAETDLVVFDYDKDKDYRMLITCKNNHIYNYDIKGKKVSGWHHNRASDPTIHPFKRLLVSGKDYIITGESNGKIHLLDRRGKNRVTVEKRIPSSKNNHLQVFRSSETAFTGVYITDETGKIFRVALDGDVQPMELGKFSPEHHFLVTDLDKDGGPEFIFFDLNLLQVFSYKKEKLFEVRIEPNASAPFLVDLVEETGIGFSYPDSQQLVLFNSKGEMVSGFPVSGMSEFDLLLTGDHMLLVTAAPEGGLLIQNIR